MPVSILKSTYKTIQEDLPKLLEKINYEPQKKKVFIKPNLVDALPPSSAVIVHPKLMEALCDFLLSRGVEEIIIGEGTGYFTKQEHFRKLIKATKYTKIEKKFNLEIENLEFADRKTVNWKYGELSLPNYVLDGEHEYINVPKMKTHCQCSVTLAMKNQKGLLLLKDKRNFHKNALHDMIFELSKTVKPDLILMDAISCLEGTGPTENTQTNVKQLNLVLAGRDLIEVDNVAARIMGYDPEEVKHIPKLDNITVIGEQLADVASPFKRPEPYIVMGPIIYHQNEKMCTQCGIAMSKTFRKILFKEELRTRFEQLTEKYPRIDFLLGAGLEEFPEGCVVPVLVGNCTMEFAKSKGIDFCKGCPPNHNDIIEFFFKLLEEEVK
ncbi:MAG: DUF362 domain-containing protein [Candidatus Helarchaeota archaeon]